MSIVVFHLNIETSHCFFCHEKIGKEEYVTFEVLGAVVPGVMHKRCDEQLTKETHWVGGYSRKDLTSKQNQSG